MMWSYVKTSWSRIRRTQDPHCLSATVVWHYTRSANRIASYASTSTFYLLPSTFYLLPSTFSSCPCQSCYWPCHLRCYCHLFLMPSPFLQNHVPLQLHTPVVRQPIPIIDPKDMQPINDPSNPIIVKVGAPKPKAMGLPLQPPTPNTPNSDPKQTRRDSPSARPLPIDSAAMAGVLRNRPASPVGQPLPVSGSSPALAPMRPPGATPPSLPDDQKGNQPRPHTPPPRGLPLSPPPHPERT